MDNKPTKSFNNLQFTQFARDLGFTISSDKEVNDPNPEFIQNLLLEVKDIINLSFYWFYISVWLDALTLSLNN